MYSAVVLVVSVCTCCAYLVVHLPLQLDDLVLHAGVELLQVLCRASFDLQLLQLPLGSRASERTLDGDGGVARPPELLPLQPAADALLDDHGLVVQQELRRTGFQTTTEQGGIQSPADHIPPQIGNTSPPIHSLGQQTPDGQRRTGRAETEDRSFFYLVVNPAGEHPSGEGLDGDHGLSHPQVGPPLSHHAVLLLRDDGGSSQTQEVCISEAGRNQNIIS